MKLENVKNQLDLVFSRAIETGVSVQQNFPVFTASSDSKFLGSIGGTSIALRNIAYKEIYTELETNNLFHIKLPDGGLLIFQYTFDLEDVLKKHRLGFFPSPVLPTLEEAPELYKKDHWYGDILGNQIVRFPIRFDYDPINYKDRHHPKSHLTLGQFENCRIPVTHAVSPNGFLLFIIRNFYFRLYRSHSNIFEKKISSCITSPCLMPGERGLPHFGFSNF